MARIASARRPTVGRPPLRALFATRGPTHYNRGCPGSGQVWGHGMDMSSAGSVSEWIGRLKAGDADAAQQLWERYFRRLVGLARAKLRSAPRRAADEEDVALSAFDSFCQAAAQGRFPQLRD